MDSIKVLVVDDERPARNKIISFLKNETESNIILEAENGLEAVKIILNEKPDIVFLDIQMPHMNGIEIIEALGETDLPSVIFTTAYEEYAIKAFEIQAIDYLLKPFNKERFQKAYERAKKSLKVTPDHNKSLNDLVKAFRTKGNFLERIIVTRSSKYILLSVKDIFHFTVKDKYVEVNTLDEKYLIRNTLRWLEEKLDPDKFKRTHRSFIVNLNYIKELQPWTHGDYIIIMKNGIKIKLARNYRKNIFNSNP